MGKITVIDVGDAEARLGGMDHQALIENFSMFFETVGESATLAQVLADAIVDDRREAALIDLAEEGLPQLLVTEAARQPGILIEGHAAPLARDAPSARGAKRAPAALDTTGVVNVQIGGQVAHIDGEVILNAFNQPVAATGVRWDRGLAAATRIVPPVGVPFAAMMVRLALSAAPAQRLMIPELYAPMTVIPSEAGVGDIGALVVALGGQASYISHHGAADVNATVAAALGDKSKGRNITLLRRLIDLGRFEGVKPTQPGAAPPPALVQLMREIGVRDTDATSAAALVDRALLISDARIIYAAAVSGDKELFDEVAAIAVARRDFAARAMALRREEQERRALASAIMDMIEWRLGYNRAAGLARQPQIATDPDRLLGALSTTERARVEQEMARRQQHEDSIATNKCPHVRLYLRMRSAHSLQRKLQLLNELKGLIVGLESAAKGRPPKGRPPRRDGWLVCNVCSHNVMCAHVLEMIETSARAHNMRSISIALHRFVDTAGVMKGERQVNRYFCKFCGEHMYDSESMSNSSSLDDVKTPPTVDEIESLLWIELRHAMHGIRFNVDTRRQQMTRVDPIKFLRQAIVTLTPWIQAERRSARRIMTVSEEELNSWVEVNAALYVMVLVAVLAAHDPMIVVMRPPLSTTSVKKTIQEITAHVTSVKAAALHKLTGSLRLTPQQLQNKASTTHATMMKAYGKGGASSLTNAIGDDLVASFTASEMHNPLFMTLTGDSPARLGDALGEKIQKIIQTGIDAKREAKAKIGAPSPSINIYGRLQLPPGPAPGTATAATAAKSAVWLLATYFKSGWWLLPREVYAKGEPVANPALEPYRAMQAKLAVAARGASIARWYHCMIPMQTPPLGQGQFMRRDVRIAEIYDQQGVKYIWKTFVYKDQGKTKELSGGDIAAAIQKGEEPLSPGAEIVDARAFPKWAPDGVLRSEVVAEAADAKINDLVVARLRQRRALEDLFIYADTRCPELFRQGNVGAGHDMKDGQCAQCGVTYVMQQNALSLNTGMTTEKHEQLIAYFNKYHDVLSEQLATPVETEESPEVAAAMMTTKPEWKPDSSIVVALADAAGVDADKLTDFMGEAMRPVSRTGYPDENVRSAPVDSADDPRILALASAANTIATDYKVLGLVISGSALPPVTGSAMVLRARYQRMVDDAKNGAAPKRPPELPPLPALVRAARATMKPTDAYQYIMQLIASTLLGLVDAAKGEADKKIANEFLRAQVDRMITTAERMLKPRTFVQLFKPKLATAFEDDTVEVQDPNDLKVDTDNMSYSDKPAFSDDFDFELGDSPDVLEANDDNLESVGPGD